MNIFFHFENHWAEARKMKNLREALFALTSLYIEIGTYPTESLRYKRCFNLANALNERIIEKWR